MIAQVNNQKKTLKYGIICENLNLSAWQIEVLNKLNDSNLAELKLIILPSNKVTEQLSIFSRVRNKVFSNTLFFSLWQRCVKNPESSLSTGDTDFLQEKNILECKIEKLGLYRDLFSLDDVENIKSNQLDFILRFGLGILTDDILGAAKYGVWSFHHGDERKYRGRPACFWEMYDNEFYIGGILQRLTNKLDSGVILKRWSINNNTTSWSSNLNELQMAGTVLPLQVCKDILNGNDTYVCSSASETKAPIKFIPNNIEMLFFLFNLSKNFIKKQIGRFYTEDWIVGVSKTKLKVNSGLPEITEPFWLKPESQDVFFADPFAVSNGNGLQVYLEKLNYRNGLGEIVSFSFENGSGFGAEQQALSLQSHLSYPFLLNYKGKQYCIPESKEGGTLFIYEVCSKSRKLIKPIVLLEQAKFSDATIFEYQGKWWLFALEGKASLVCYYSVSLFGPWLEHNNNPLKIDVYSARPAGPLFVVNGDLIRPTQDCSKEYGWRINFNKINMLDTGSFDEEHYGVLEASDDWSYNHGIHTISEKNGYLIFDAKSKSIKVKSIFKRLYKKLLIKN